MPTFTVFKGAKDGVPKQSATQKPDQLVKDQVLLRVTASGICGTGMCIT
jgi:threonine dehydrogenase-like Zn-dependent dehydrogenase